MSTVIAADTLEAAVLRTVRELQEHGALFVTSHQIIDSNPVSAWWNASTMAYCMICQRRCVDYLVRAGHLTGTAAGYRLPEVPS